MALSDIFHTKIGPALADGSTWASIAAGVTAAALLPQPFNYVVAAMTVPGALLKGGATPPEVK